MSDKKQDPKKKQESEPTKEQPRNPKTQGNIELIGVPDKLRRKYHYILKDVEENGWRKKWLWNWYFVIILGSSNSSYNKGREKWTDKYDDQNGGRIVLEKIDATKYQYYKYFDNLQQDEYNKELDELRKTRSIGT
jgi:hypothetical protein